MKDLECNMIWMRPVAVNWPPSNAPNSTFFWTDVFTMINDCFAEKKLLQHESRVRDAVRAAGDLRLCVGYLRMLVRNSEQSKGSAAVSELKHLWLERQAVLKAQGGDVEALEDGIAEDGNAEENQDVQEDEQDKVEPPMLDVSPPGETAAHRAQGTPIQDLPWPATAGQ